MPHFALIASTIAVMLGQATPSQSAAVPDTLSKFLSSLHWDSASSGTLIAVEADHTRLDLNASPGLTGFERKKVKVGKLTVIAPSWTIALDDSDMPNPYDQLTESEKLAFLLATLSSSQLSELTGPGLSAREVSGEQRAALLSLIPKQMTYMVGTVQGSSFRSSDPPTTLTDEQVDQVKVQLRKGVEVSFAAVSNGPAGMGNRVISSLGYRGADGSTAVMERRSMFPAASPEYPGRIVDSVEKRSEISWTDPRLSQEVPLQDKSLIAEVLAAVRQKTGVEVYADVRIESLELDAYGPPASAADLLRGLTLAVDGVIRKVGPAYVLTANIEGEASRETRLLTHKTMGQVAIAGRVAVWKAEVLKRGILDSLSFPADDPFQAGSISSTLFSSGKSGSTTGWVPESQLPASIASAIAQVSGSSRGPKGASPLESLKDQAKISTCLGYRLVLPDGRPLDSHRLDARALADYAPGGAHALHENVPVDPASLPAGSAIGLRSNDANAVAGMCVTVAKSGFSEIWLDSTSPDAIRAAIASGLKVDLVLHPWAVLPGETCHDFDRNVLGQSGSQIVEIEGARYDPLGGKIYEYTNSFSPADPELSEHWSRLMKQIPATGIYRLIVIDTAPEGYKAPTNRVPQIGGDVFVNNTPVKKGIHGMDPYLFAFGFSTALRLEFLRQNHIDPIDITEKFTSRRGPPSIYFDQPPLSMGHEGPYHSVYFPPAQTQDANDKLNDALHAFRNATLHTKMREFHDLLAKAHSDIFMEVTEPNSFEPFAYLGRNVQQSEGDFSTFVPTAPFVYFAKLGPENLEDENGALTYGMPPLGKSPMCFDLSNVPPAKLATYLRFLFKHH